MWGAEKTHLLSIGQLPGQVLLSRLQLLLQGLLLSLKQQHTLTQLTKYNKQHNQDTKLLRVDQLSSLCESVDTRFRHTGI